MGVDYRLKIFRKCDDKLLGIVDANHLKAIFDSEFDYLIHCDGRDSNKKRFTYSELEDISKNVKEKIDSYYSSIFEKKIMIMNAASIDIKHELEEDINFIRDDIQELNCVFESTCILMGMISCIVENLYDKDDKYSAYEYNGSDLPKKIGEYPNGEKYEYSQCVWNYDVYCEVEANW